jgi:phospholipid/cholesterol/gamma-HCH transport system permease protein
LSQENVEVRRQEEVLVVGLSGDWSLSRAIPRFRDLVESEADPPEALEFDASGLGSWDSSLLVFVRQAGEWAREHDAEFRDATLPEEISGLFALAQTEPDREAGADDGDGASLVTRVGEKGIGVWEGARAAVTFSGEVAVAMVGLATRRVRLRWRDFWSVVHSNSAGALPIVTLIALLVGMIIAFLGAVVLRRFGAGYYVSYLVGYGMLREMAALMTGIIMAGRTGAAFAAELGSMKISEEIDALRTLGISPVEHLVLPRVLGLFVMMPLLTIYAFFIGIGGGLLVSISILDLTPTQFVGGMLYVVTLPDALLGVFKGTVFGLIIGMAGCMKGMQTGGDASAVGRAATSAVVIGITLIVLTNAIIDWLAVLLDI